jgi:hypothetical protein
MFTMPLAGKHSDRRSNFNGSPLGGKPQHTTKNLQGAVHGRYLQTRRLPPRGKIRHPLARDLAQPEVRRSPNGLGVD